MINPDPLNKALLLSLLPMSTLLVGSGIAVIRPPGRALRSALLHFAAGVVFSVVAVELLPDVIQRHAPIEMAIGFSCGVGTMLLLRSLSRKQQTAQTTSAISEVAPQALGIQPFPYGLIFGVGIDIVVDGILLGIGFTAGVKEGRLLAWALAIELLSLGLAAAVSLGKAGVPRIQNVATNGVFGLLFVGAALSGVTLFSQLADEWLELVLSFGLAALLFLVTEELLVEAHEETENPFLTLAFFCGFLVFLILGMVL